MRHREPRPRKLVRIRAEQCAEVVEKESATHSTAEEALHSSYTAHRTALLAQGQVLSPEALSSSYHHGRAQCAAVELARTALDRAQKRLTVAQDSVSARLEISRHVDGGSTTMASRLAAAAASRADVTITDLPDVESRETTCNHTCDHGKYVDHYRNIT